MGILVNGFRLCGPLEQSHEWPASRPMPAQLFDSRELPYRAGGIRQRVVQKLEKSFKHSDPIHQREIWEKSLEDVAEGYAVGPFYEEGEVECILGTPSWIAMPRFPVLQADKVRYCVLTWQNIWIKDRPEGPKLQNFTSATRTGRVLSSLPRNLTADVHCAIN